MHKIPLFFVGREMKRVIRNANTNHDQNDNNGNKDDDDDGKFDSFDNNNHENFDSYFYFPHDMDDEKS